MIAETPLNYKLLILFPDKFRTGGGDNRVTPLLKQVKSIKMNITIVTHDKGTHILLSIFDVHENEDILTFDKWFSSLDEIEKFKESKLFKRIFNTISKIK